MDYPPLFDSAHPGDPILLDDGNVVLVRVCALCGWLCNTWHVYIHDSTNLHTLEPLAWQEVVDKVAGQGVKCRALNSGKIKNRRGVNVPNSKVRSWSYTDVCACGWQCTPLSLESKPRPPPTRQHPTKPTQPKG